MKGRIRELLRAVNRRLETVSISQRTMLTTLLLIIVSISILATFSTMRTTRVLSEEILATREMMIESTARSISSRFEEAVRVGNLTLQQKTVVDAMEKIALQKHYPLKDQLTDAKAMEEFVYRLQFSHDLVRVRLLFLGEAIYVNENINFFPLSSETAQMFSDQRRHGQYVHITQGVYPYIFQNARNVFSVHSTLESPSDFFDVMGVVAVDIDALEIFALLQPLAATEREAVVLYNAQGETIYADGEAALAQMDIQSTQMQQWLASEDNEVYFYPCAIGNTGWHIAYRVYRSELFSSIMLLQRDLIYALLAVLAIAYALSLLSSRLSVRRIRTLATAMEQVCGGNLEFHVQEGGNNEIGVLERSFNYLQDVLQEMLENKMKDGMALQNAQIRLLQTQIQPHFLYNTLDMISWRLLLNNDQEGSRLVQALAHFYKIGLSRGQEMIPLRDELLHVQLYIEIQNFRLDDRVKLEIHAEPECLEHPVLGNILQPLVENAVMHGVLENEKSTGCVEISAYHREGHLHIRISDDGIGMNPETMHALLERQQENHFGVWNIQQRIRLVYGEAYGLQYERNDLGGTDVLILLPWSADARGA